MAAASMDQFLHWNFSSHSDLHILWCMIGLRTHILLLLCGHRVWLHVTSPIKFDFNSVGALMLRLRIYLTNQANNRSVLNVSFLSSAFIMLNLE
ncbi:hypothetical protein F2Q70_00009062 [Brassica cretica]|uniref:Uncharacterized protein n=1 Tax=Brassica cretica TaxID=69181 RepID=A0A8S9M1L4_BRACR|nr:hypothetical protein F2Q70_00009062 [Brassica cretica]